MNTWCILMYEAVTVLTLMMMTSTVFEESLARYRHTHTHTDRHGVVYVNFFVKVSRDFENKETRRAMLC